MQTKIRVIGGGSIEQANQLTICGLRMENELGNSTFSVKSVAFTEMKRLSDELLFLAVKHYHLSKIIARLFYTLRKHKFLAKMFIRRSEKFKVLSISATKAQLAPKGLAKPEFSLFTSIKGWSLKER